MEKPQESTANCTLGRSPQRNEKLRSLKNLFMNVHSSFTSNNQKCGSSSPWHVIHPCHGILPSRKKEWTVDTDNLDTSPGIM